MAVDYNTQMMGLIGFACGRGAFQAFLKRFSGVSNEISDVIAHFRWFRGLGNPLKAPHAPPYGVREGRGMHLCRPGPWAGSGGGMGLEIRRAARRMPAADLQGSHDRGRIKRRKYPAHGRGINNCHTAKTQLYRLHN